MIPALCMREPKDDRKSGLRSISHRVSSERSNIQVLTFTIEIHGGIDADCAVRTFAATKSKGARP